MKKAVVLAIILALVLPSCRPYEDLSRDFTPATTWGELFDLYWKRMSTNYLFWELDYNGGKDWDRVYDEYMPLFSELGEIENNIESREKAYSYFYDIISPLSDRHYTFDLSTSGHYRYGDGDSIRFGTDLISQLEDFGYTKEEIIKVLMNDSSAKELIDAYKKTIFDTADNTASYILDNAGFNIIDSFAPCKAYLAKNSEGILYFGFCSFDFSTSDSTDLEHFLQNYYSEITKEDLKGIIIDLRGNDGGNFPDIGLLWTPFMPDSPSLMIYESKKKASEGRVDYGPYISTYVLRNEAIYSLFGSVNKDIPIAILQGSTTISAAEISIMLFHLFNEQCGYSVRTFGDKTSGGNGALVIDDAHDGNPVAENFFNGGITFDLRPYGNIIYTSSLFSRFYDGNVYEGKGIECDEKIDFDYEEYIKGDDARLNSAISWIKDF